MKHTPGPWKVDDSRIDDMNGGIGKAVAFADRRRVNYKANANLIAAAPEMYEALKAIVKVMDGSQPIDYPGALMVAQYAIKKAEGKAEATK